MHKTFFTITIVALTIGVSLWKWSPQQAADYVCNSATEFRESISGSNSVATNTWAETTTKTLQWRLSHKVAESVDVLTAVPKGQQYAMLRGLIQNDTKDPTWACEEAKLLLEENPVTPLPQKEATQVP
jgi:hypothetical protein